MEFSKICRLCLRETHLPYSLTEEEGILFLRDVASIEIDSGDPFPKFACISCWLNLKHAYKIRENFLKTDEKLKSMLFSPELLIDEEGFVSEESLISVIKATTRQNLQSDKEENMVCNSEEQSSETRRKTHSKTPKQPKVLEPVETIKIQNLTDGDFTILIVKDDIPKDKGNERKKTLEKSKCQICGDLCLESEIMDHIKEHFEVKETCKICRVQCENLGQFRLHMKMQHNQDLKEVNRCVICFATFQYKILYLLHARKAHEDSEIHSNKTKNNYMMNKLGMKLNARAWEVLTQAGKELQCDICNKVCTNTAKLVSHMTSHRSRRQCPTCGKFVSAANISVHIRSHYSEPVVCGLCGNMQKNVECLRSHMTNAHSTKIFSCDHCGKGFATSYKRKIHIKKAHTGEKDFICQECGKAFFTQYRLSIHTRNVHLKIRKCKCSYCGKGFVKRWNLKIHERQHTREKPYSCVYCGEGFRQNVSLKNHLKSKHQEENEDDQLADLF